MRSHVSPPSSERNSAPSSASTRAQTRSGRAGETATPILPSTPRGKPGQRVTSTHESPPSVDFQRPDSGPPSIRVCGYRCACQIDGGLPEAGLRTAVDQGVRVPLRLPDCRVEDPRIARVHRDVVGAGALALEQDLVPRVAAVGGAEDTSFGIRPKRMSQCRHVHRVRVFRMNADLADVARVAQTDLLPRATGVGAAVHTIAMRDVVANTAFARAYINDIRVRLGDCNRPD